MKKILLLLFIINSAFLSAQINTLNTFNSEKKEFLKSDSLKSNNYFSHQSVSLGGGISYGMELKSKGLLFNIATSFHFSKALHFEIEYIYGKAEGEKYGGHLLSTIFQFGLLNVRKWQIYLGGGLEAIAEDKSGMILPTGNAKLEYNISKYFSVNTATRFYPLTQTINLSFNLPY